MTDQVKVMRLESKILKQKSKAENLNSYASMMSHEFRTPLETSLMYLEMVLELITDDKCHDMINIVKISLSLLKNLVLDMVDLRMIKANRFKSHKKTFSPTKVLKFVKSLLDI